MKSLAKATTAALATVLAAVLVPATTARAAVDITGQFGHWAVIEGEAVDGKRVCGVATTGGSGADQRYLAVRFFPEHRRLQVQINKKSWSIPRGTRVPVEIEFHGFPGAWRSESGAEGNGNGMVLNFGFDAGVKFLDEFTRAARGVVRFGGNEGVWSVNLEGSRAAGLAMVDCVRRSIRTLPAAPSQPFSSSDTPQPFAPTTKPPAAAPDSGRPQSVVGTSRERRT